MWHGYRDVCISPKHTGQLDRDIFSTHCTKTNGKECQWWSMKIAQRVNEGADLLEFLSLSRNSPYGHQFLAAAASTYYTLRSERNYFGRQFGRCRIHHNGIDSCRRHRTSYISDTYTVGRMEMIGIAVFCSYKSEKWRKNHKLCLPCQNARRTFGSRLGLSAAYHISCKSILLASFGRNGGPRSHRGNIDNCRSGRNRVSTTDKSQ